MTVYLKKEEVLDFIKREIVDVNYNSKMTRGKDQFYNGAALELRIINAGIQSGKYDVEIVGHGYEQNHYA